MHMTWNVIVDIDLFNLNMLTVSGLTKMDLTDSQLQPLALSETLTFDGVGTPLQATLASPQE